MAPIFYQYRALCDKNSILKEQLKRVIEKGFHHALNTIDDFDDELVRYVLSKIDD